MSADRTEAAVRTTRSGHVAWIELNRPHKRNAVDRATRALLAESFDAVSVDPDVRVVVLTGAGSAFCAGVDLTDSHDDDRHVLLRAEPPLATPVESCTKPVIAAVNGPAAGGGFELALAAQLRVATPSARFTLPETRIGSLPGSGGTQRLFGALPSAVAWKLLLTGGTLSAQDAARYGLVSDVVDEADFRSSVEELAQTVASVAPLSSRAALIAGRAASESGLETGLALERSLWGMLAGTEDREEGRAAFRDKRPPEYRGR